ncbi:hypothetical protein [uncultured Methanobrevibacter sp.]|uniref:hypothetical protein n=1 Tax=uncultured Methanobrevibacter sp. TaxID=253161 RepID=UPI00261B2DF7|nr:hypothetical protein [uncultured Methanobrevibacter sp.]
MKKDSKFFKYIILTDPGSLSMTERMGIILIPLIFITCMLLHMFVTSHEVLIFLWLFGIWIFFIGLGYPLIYFEKYEEKYGWYSKIRFGSTYQIISKTLSYLIPGLIINIIFVGLILENTIKASLIAFAFLPPFLALFFRTDVFNDNSSIEGDEIIFGYHPSAYGLLSLFLGIYGYLTVDNLLNSNFNLAVMLFTITVIFQVLLLIPDKLNKVLFFEVRRINGFLAYIGVLIICYAILCFFITGGNNLTGINIDLSFEGIVRKAIMWGTGILIAILYIRKIKDMTQK